MFFIFVFRRFKWDYRSITHLPISMAQFFSKQIFRFVEGHRWNFKPNHPRLRFIFYRRRFRRGAVQSWASARRPRSKPTHTRLGSLGKLVPQVAKTEIALGRAQAGRECLERALSSENWQTCPFQEFQAPSQDGLFARVQNDALDIRNQVWGSHEIRPREVVRLRRHHGKAAKSKKKAPVTSAIKWFPTIPRHEVAGAISTAGSSSAVVLPWA